MFDRIYDDTINNKLQNFTNLPPCDLSRVAAALLSGAESAPNFVKISSDISLLKGFSRLLLNLSIFSDNRCCQIFRKFVQSTSAGHGAFVIFNFVCPTIFPSHVNLSNSQSIQENAAILTEILTADSQGLPPAVKSEYAAEMKLVLSRHVTASRIAKLSETLGVLRQGL